MDLFAFVHKKKPLSARNDREVLALAIQSEEEDGRICREFAERLQVSYPGSADIFSQMAEEESKHRRRLLDVFAERFGDHLPLIRREDVRGFIRRPPVWMSQSFDIDAVRDRVEAMEVGGAKVLRDRGRTVPYPAVRKLFGDLSEAEAGHEALAKRLEAGLSTDTLREEAKTARRLFVLQIVQPALAGLMDGSVSTLAPVLWGVRHSQ